MRCPTHCPPATPSRLDVAETREERRERLLNPLRGRFGAGAMDFASRLLDHHVGLAKRAPKASGDWYTLSPAGDSAVRVAVAEVIEAETAARKEQAPDVEPEPDDAPTVRVEDPDEW